MLRNGWNSALAELKWHCTCDFYLSNKRVPEKCFTTMSLLKKIEIISFIMFFFFFLFGFKLSFLSSLFSSFFTFASFLSFSLHLPFDLFSPHTNFYFSILFTPPLGSLPFKIFIEFYFSCFPWSYPGSLPFKEYYMIFTFSVPFPILQVPCLLNNFIWSSFLCDFI